MKILVKSHNFRHLTQNDMQVNCDGINALILDRSNFNTNRLVIFIHCTQLCILVGVTVVHEEYYVTK